MIPSPSNQNNWGGNEAALTQHKELHEMSHYEKLQKLYRNDFICGTLAMWFGGSKKDERLAVKEIDKMGAWL